jgi:serine/threonine protein kinase
MVTSQERYEVIETIGSGATSRVDKARDNVIGRTVALKTFVQGFGSRDLQQQFLREAQIVGGLSHPNIVALYDVGTNQDGKPYFVMEYVQGKTLDSALLSAPLPLQRLARWGGDLATALGQAHRASVVHGDVKPENILVTLDDQIKLGDFGIARLVTHVSASGNLMGTPAYLSPEQILGKAQDSRTDIFSLGIVLYQMATGFRPFDGDSVTAVCSQIISSSPLPPSQRNPSLPPGFDQVVMRCLSKNAQDRFPTAESLAAALYPFARNTQAQAQAQSQPQPQRRARERGMVAVTAKQAQSTRSWWNRPLKWNEAWPVAAGVLALLLSFPILGAVRKHAIATTAAASTPAVPAVVTENHGFTHESAFPSSSSPSSTSLEDTGWVKDWLRKEEPAPAKAESKKTATSAMAIAETPATSAVTGSKNARRSKASMNSQRTPTAPVSQMQPASPPDANAAGSLPDSKSEPSTPASSMRVEIVSAVAEGRLTVFSGQQVLLSTKLASARPGEAMHFNCPLPTGAHALRVALYRPDDSLQLQKEGFAEIVLGSPSALDIHIERRSKFFIRKELTMEVIWPGSHSGDSQEASSVTPNASISK